MKKGLPQYKETKGIFSWFLQCFISDKKLQKVSNLYSGKTRIELREHLGKELLKKLIPITIFSIGLIIVAVFLFLKETPINNTIKRPSFGSSVITEEFVVEMEDGSQVVELQIAPREYKQEEIEVLYKEAEEYLDSVVLAQNESFSRIIENLYFPTSIPTTGEEISWSTESPWLIASDGVVCNEMLETDTFVEIRAKISYGSEYRVYKKVVTVVPKVYTEQEQNIRNVMSYLQQAEQQTRTEEWFEVPEEVLGWRIIKQQEKGWKTPFFLVLVSITIPILVYSRFFEHLETLQKRRKEEAENSYSEFVTKVSLLLAAGVPVRQCFFRLAKEYEQNYGEEHILTIELKRIKQELEYGHSENVVYETFGRRIGVLSYQRMASLLTQNVSKGVQGIRVLLLQEAKEVMAEERAKIKIKGEQAGTKLLFPMMGLLALVFAILLVPAFQSL